MRKKEEAGHTRIPGAEAAHPHGKFTHACRKGCLTHDTFFFLFLACWGLFNLLTLTRFPHAHSDEAWLAGLSRAIWTSGSLRTTEPFFNLFPRQPHLMKVLYHLVQGPLQLLPGPGLFWARLPSLAAAAGTLAVVYGTAKRRFGAGIFALLLPVAMGCHPQFLYAAHFGRQESLLVLALVLADDLYDRHRTTRLFALVPCIIGVAALLHPNAFVLAAMLGMRLLSDLACRALPPRKLLTYGGILAGWAVLLLAGSLWLNPGFLNGYAAFGASLSVDAAWPDRQANFIGYFVKLYDRITGTYWLPDIRFWMLAAGLGTMAAVIRLIRTGIQSKPTADIHSKPAAGVQSNPTADIQSNPTADIHSKPTADIQSNPADSADTEECTGLRAGMAELAGFLAGMWIIGRFNPTAIVFALPPLFRMLAALVHPGFMHGAAPFPRRRFPAKFSRVEVSRAMLQASGICLLIVSLLGGVSTLAGFLVPTTPTASMADAETGAGMNERPGAGTDADVFLNGWLGDPQYEAYLQRARGALSGDAVVLGNLSAGFALEEVPFHDIRNLAPVGGERPDPAVWMAEHGINTVFWYEEYDYILRNPRWRILYEAEPDAAGPADAPTLPATADAGFLADLRALLDAYGTPVETFTSSVYGTRIVRYMGDHPWQITAYRVDPARLARK